MTVSPPRVRFAPSPTGYLHVGGARTALFNWLFARKEGGVFVLRIEDTDRARSSDEMTEAILDGLSWLGLDWDEGPFHQADGFETHRAAVERLLASGTAYRCFCTQEELQKRRAAEGSTDPDAYRYDRSCLRLDADDSTRRAQAGEPFAVRFEVPPGTTRWDDAVHGESTFRNEDIEDFIILRTDGTPTYNLAVVSDDIEMAITHVIRGDDHLSNTPKQILLYEALGATVPTFVHLPMILGPDGKRLSKRHGATSVGEYRQDGILSEALVNFLALLGWSTGDDQEIMSASDLVSRFSLERINRKSAVFDTEKLEWMSGQHISLARSADLLPLVAGDLVSEGLLSQQEIESRADWLHGIIDLVKVRARTLGAIVDTMRPFIEPTIEYERAAVEKHWKDPALVAKRLTVIRDDLNELDDWQPAAIEATLRSAAERLGVGFGKVVHPLRLALTGASVSPGIDVVVAAMGREMTSARLSAAIEALTASGNDNNLAEDDG
ncbi:MAG TPA: glutamate--tRNA ligase [Longimicrobiaceae bacterium]|nr:glutamate--tRNA ligase [Longimicrobiaceae bacterium]